MAEETPKFASLLLPNVVITDTKLGSGGDASVHLAEMNGTPCAAKRLHEVLLEDETPRGPEKLIDNFEAECLTWSKLRHPGIVQFFGVHLVGTSRFPVLVMEKMDTSLRRYLDDNSKEAFSVYLKVSILRQVAQALVYLHSQKPVLVHHDLSPNNVLLNIPSFIAKVSDFGMSRAIQPFSFSRKSSIKGTPAFMPPEALHDPPKYNESLDVFSFGNVIVATVTHDWPNPGQATKFKGDELVAVTEFQRREHHTDTFTPEEKKLFLPIVRQCLDNNPEKRPTSMQLVTCLQQIEESLSNGTNIASAFAQLHQRLVAMEEECTQKDKALNEAQEERNELLKEKEKALREKAEALKEKDEAILIIKEAEDSEMTFEDVQAAFVKYGVEVETWEDVPFAVQQLAYMRQLQALPDALQQPPTSSDVLLVWEFTKCLPSWLDIATHLGCSSDYIVNMHDKGATGTFNTADTFDKCCRIQLFADWIAKNRGTGNKPRTWKVVLEAFRRCCVHSQETLDMLSRFEERLINGQKLYCDKNDYVKY